MTRLVIRGDALHATARGLRGVRDDLWGAGAGAASAADAVGHETLASALRDFAERWNQHRSHALDGISGLADAFDAVNATLADLEANLSSPVREATATADATLADANTGELAW